MGMSENTFYRLSGICGIVAIVLALPSVYIFGLEWNFAIIVTGILAIVALFLENKICLLVAMIGGIIAAICLAFLMVGTVFLAGGCALGDAASASLCEYEHDHRTLQASCDRGVEGHNCETNPTCCFGCTATGKCTGAGCEWVAEYKSLSCGCNCEEKDQTSCNDADQSGCVCPTLGSLATESECTTAKTTADNAAGCSGASCFGGTGWTCTTSTIKATCAKGKENKKKNKVAAAGDCTALAAPGTLPASSGYVDCDTLEYQTVANTAWANTGCESDGIVATADTGEEEADGSHYCEYAGIASFLVFLHLGVVIAISVGGCCVVCCGKGPDDGDDDDGKSDE